jgi:hypothetical protein
VTSLARRNSLVLLALGLALTAPSGALANGDPASDVLAGGDVFVPGEFNSAPPTGLLPPDRVAQLRALVMDSRAHGYRIKIALISAPSDLGLVYQLWRQPQRYASFLGQELRAYWSYRGRLLVVMPNGLGFSRGGKAVAADQAVVDRIAPPHGSAVALATAATRAVVRLAAGAGVPVKVRPLAGDAHVDNQNRERLLIVLATAIALAGFGGFVLLRRRLRGARR